VTAYNRNIGGVICGGGENRRTHLEENRKYIRALAPFVKLGEAEEERRRKY